jgi:hypothetical protein
MRSAKRREEVVESLFVSEIDNLQASAELIPVAAENVVMSNSQVE